ncbi:MAG: enoyl-CoA hydratase/isomerase family protein [Gammaproteobacteria bacterium]
MLKISMRDSVAEIRLDRPPVNAMNPELIRSLATTHANLVADGAAAIVISGRQGLFSAGLDVPELLRLAHGEVLEFWTEFFSLMSALAASPVPVAAAITGHAPAGGAVLALHCDYRVATRGDFLIGLNEVQVGLPVPPNILRMPLQYGLVDELADEGGAVDAAVLWANGLLELPPLAMNTTRLAAKKILVDMAEANLRYANKATEYWFSEETQRMMRKLVAKLTTKQN